MSTQEQMTDIEERVIEIVAEGLGVDKEELTLDKSFVEDLNADSLDVTELVMNFEEKFECEIPIEEAEQLKTVGDVVNYITSRRQES